VSENAATAGTMSYGRKSAKKAKIASLAKNMNNGYYSTSGVLFGIDY